MQRELTGTAKGLLIITWYVLCIGLIFWTALSIDYTFSTFITDISFSIAVGITFLISMVVSYVSLHMVRLPASLSQPDKEFQRENQTRLTFSLLMYIILPPLFMLFTYLTDLIMGIF